MKLDLSLWNVGFTIITALVWGYFTLARSRVVNQEILIGNADRFEKLYRARDEENVRLRDRVKALEGEMVRSMERYDRIMRRVVEVEDYLGVVLAWAERYGHTVPVRPGQ